MDRLLINPGADASWCPACRQTWHWGRAGWLDADTSYRVCVVCGGELLPPEQHPWAMTNEKSKP